ncbi:alpha-L-fucosidase [Mucilaginibacter mallensis]|uniref:alpha-L-fucosidase n=1 Tax=Mucilaginibacter mallensis TaxID=652787 RepID=A0A1H1RIX6_MUCMA|nr:alpha-L-fucosidase [Mucilaginibacter mallensis]SDS35650.1 alpha-L-fucosidase [Mucilaginibacter mallensis]
MKYFFSLLILLSCVAKPKAQTLIDPTIKTPHAVMDDFMDQRFGMFIHWGPVTLRGTEIGWSRGHEVPTAEYDSLYKEFDPILFNADAWVKTAKDAGMKYVVITAKHHDGFCLWPTKSSDYNIMNTPFKKDVVGELAAACKKYNLKFCIYFTVLDWHDPHYPNHNGASPPDSLVNMNEFVKTMKSELKELVTTYHPYMLWFDGNWEKPWKNEYAVDVYTYLKQLDPNVIINNRLGANDEHVTLNSRSIGDYATPEQVIGALDMNTPWETCMTICTQWAWKPNDKMKSLKECLQTLVKTAGGNGNLLFNVGPMPDGRMEQRQVTRLKEMGDWLKIYGESIYGTKGGPFAPNNDFATTRKGNKLYVHVFEKKSDLLTLPLATKVKVKQAYLLNGGEIKYSQDTTGNITLQLPDQLPNNNDTVIALELTTSAEAIPVVSHLN